MDSVVTRQVDNNQLSGSFGKIKSRFYFIEDIFCIAALVLLAVFPLLEILVHFIFKTGIPASSGFIVHFLLFSALIGGMICTRNESHLAISLMQYVPEGAVRERIKTCTNLISAFISIIIAWSSISFIKMGLDDGIIGFIPRRVLASIIPLAFTIISIRFARRANLTGWKIIIPVCVILLGTVASFPVIAKVIWGFEKPEIIEEICFVFADIAVYMKLPVVIFLIISALAGTPLFIVLAGLSLMLLQASDPWLAVDGVMDTVANKIYFGLINQNIIAIPLFAIVGFFLSESKAGERLVNTFRSFFGWLPGGIIIVSVIICAFFTSFTGASGITILALGGILYVILSEHLKYPQKFSIGLLTSVGSIGLLFPPSLPLILVGTVLLVDIRHLFLGGIIPGIILVAAMIIFGIIISVKVKIPVEKFELKKALVSLKGSSLEILLPVFLITAYFGGFLNLTQLGAVAVLYIFIVEVLIHRDIKITDIKKIFDKAIPIIGGVLSILAVASAFSYYIVDTQAPSNVASWMQSTISSKIVFLLILNLALLVIGLFLDMFSAILIVLPLIIPLGEIYGIDPVHLGIIFLVNLEVGYITPPVGLNLFLASYRFQKPFIEICKHVFPFMLVRLVVVLLVTYLPWLSTWLVGIFFPPEAVMEAGMGVIEVFEEVNWDWVFPD
ncbi:MAG: TRAP transporter large permease subunit [Treponema sp.]|nr:TRAP transporter large permease subunit [Treponema sp.]